MPHLRSLLLPCCVALTLMTGCSFFSDPNEVEIGQPDMGGGDVVDGGSDASQPTADDVGDEGGGMDAGATDMSVPDEDMTPPDTCGDGALQEQEKCDPAIEDTMSSAYCPRLPEDCEDGVSCTRGVISGSPRMCNAVCAQITIDVCEDGDGCCPAECTPDQDDDCAAEDVCGDAMVTGSEMCDPGISPDAAGGCPKSAVDDCAPMQCMKAVVTGSATTCNAVCEYNEITVCDSRDGCCPAGCDATSDADCAATCGNGVTEPGEQCDGNCPTACDDGIACTTDVLAGSAADCDAVCTNVQIAACIDDDGCCPAGCTSAQDNDCSASCGDGIIDANETCDGDCPTFADCNDNNSCTTDTLQGSAAQCTAQCSSTLITSCTAVSDGCCPTGCNANNDSDCVAICGNGIVEAGEACDGPACPTSCDDGDVCTDDALQGTAANCTAECVATDITSCVDGDGCCAPGCNATNDDDCGAVCGNGVTEPGETCDGNCPPSCNDGNACTIDVRAGSASSCNVTCSYSDINSCVDDDGCCPGSCNANNDSDCDASCGNGVVEGAELCDGDCPVPAECTACESFSGSAGTCDAQCVAEVGCVLCDPGGSCPCAAGELCVDGRCEAATGEDCQIACEPNDYCSVWGGAGFECVGDDCIECSVDADCEPAEYCDAGACKQAPACDQASEPNTWCKKNTSRDVCVNGECYPACSDTVECKPLDTCDPMYRACVPATSCDEAAAPGQWCQANDLGDVCYNGDCYYKCSPAGPSGACGCRKPSKEACVQVGSGDLVCVPALNCGQVCETQQDAFCEAYFPGTTCESGTCK